MFNMLTQRIRKHPPKREIKRLTKRQMYTQLSIAFAELGIGLAGIIYLGQLVQYWVKH